MVIRQLPGRVRARLITPANLDIARDYVTIVVGTAVTVVAMHFFFIPNTLVVGGVSGTAQIINSFTGWPIGTMVFIFNVPLFLLGWRYLGGKRFLIRTVVSATLYSVMLDGLQFFLPTQGITDDLLLNTLYGGILGGIGGGLVLRAKATGGGTDILARFLDKKYGIPISQGYLYTDGLIVLIAGLAFGWEFALYAIIGLYVWSIVAEVAMTGLNVERIVTIITNEPELVARQIMSQLERGVTAWEGQGMYTGQARKMLLCAVSRAEIGQVKALVYEADPGAFVIIGQAHEVLGEGFRRLTKDD
ncbi:MAG: YitT family protein [Chloroflexi bacterium]|nr:YitT family protein [Chloroflexota bacterium]